MIKYFGSIQHVLFGISLLLFCIPLEYGYSTAALCIFILLSLINFQKNRINFNSKLLLPIILYAIMLLSYFWTIDQKLTLSALSKVVPILLIPLTFIINGKITYLDFSKIIKTYSYSIVFFCIIFIGKAGLKFFQTQNDSEFYYHNLVGEDINAIYFSFFLFAALFYFINENSKKWFHYLIISFLILFLFLLSSKMVIVIFFLLLSIYFFLYHLKTRKSLYLSFFILLFGLISVMFIGKFKDRIISEIDSNLTISNYNQPNNLPQNSVNVISIKDAWTKEVFSPNDYFPGSAFRVYQARIFFELIGENNVFFTGFGFGASQIKIEEKTISYNLFNGSETQEGYKSLNFHNQYFQIFSEIGIFGFLIFLAMILYSIKIVIKTKKFFLFAIVFLMCMVFFTESFLIRQRGILFFMLIYCLIHQTEFTNKIEIEQ